MRNARSHFVARSFRAGLTLIELMVTLVLSVLVLGMVMPLLTALLKTPSAGADLQSPSWQPTLQADLSELVSPSKCGVPIFQLLPASDTQAYPELVIETFCRASGSDLTSLSRGPSEIRYCLETDLSAGPLALVRYSKGWHDPVATRYVLARHLTGWTIDFDGIAPPQADSSDMPSAAARAGRLIVALRSESNTNQVALWVPLLSTRPPEKAPNPQQDPTMQGNEATASIGGSMP
jgi:hypothetical protein